MQGLRRLLPYAPYLGLVLLVMGPLLAPGYVLTMDLVFTPVLRLPDHVDNTWLLYAVLHALDIVLPADIVQKLVLVACLLLSGVGIHRLLRALRPAEGRLSTHLHQGGSGVVQPEQRKLSCEKCTIWWEGVGAKDRHWQWAVYVAATFYMINPFVYDRLMAGQWGVWLGYALLPWFARSLLGLVIAPGRCAGLRLGLWLTIMSIVSIHSVGYAVLLIGAAIASQAQDWGRLRVLIKYVGISVLVFLVASLYWLLPTLLGQGRIASSLATFTVSGHQAFATVDAIGTSPFGAVLGLLGFWQEVRDLYLTPIESYPLWGLAHLALLVLIALGAVQAWRRQRGVAVWAFAAGLLAVLFAAGLASELVRLLPFMAGYREPQKFAAVWALAAAYLLAWALTWLLARVRARPVVLAAAMGLVLAYTPVMLWGAAGQLRTTDYPADWFRANRILNEQDGRLKVLVLPWHLYMSYNFTHGRIIAGPAHAFYDRDVVASDDPELPGVTPQTRDMTREAVQNDILPAGLDGHPIAERLGDLGVGYIILNKDLDWTDYAYIGRELGVTVLYDGPNLRLYDLTK